MPKKTEPKPEPKQLKSKKTAEPATEFNRQKELEILRAGINKSFGAGVLITGDELTNVYALRRPTGVPQLDIALAGGLPAGGISQLIGKDSVGKTYMANRIAANIQSIYGPDMAISLAMTETRYDKKFAKKCNLHIAMSPDELAKEAQMMGRDLTPEETADFTYQIGYVDFPSAANAELLLEVVAQQIESNLYQFVLIDSIGALLTEAEAEAEGGITQGHYAGAATIITRFMHRVHSAMVRPDARGRPNTTTVLVINQYRDKIGISFGNPMSIQGGNALKHGKLVDILLVEGKNHFLQLSQTKKVCIGKEVHWEIIKGKAGCHDGPKGSYQFYFGEEGYPFGINLYEDLLVAGMTYGVVEANGAWYYFEGERIGQGKENVAVFLHDHPDCMAKIHAAVLDKSGCRFITKEL